MSKTNAAVLSPPAIDPTTDTLPTLDRAGVVEYCAALGVSVTERYVRVCTFATETRNPLPRFIVGHKMLFARADVRKWLAAMRRNTTD